MEFRDARNIMESLLFITEQPIPIKSFEDLFDKEFSREDLLKMAEDIALIKQSNQNAEQTINKRGAFAGTLAGGFLIISWEMVKHFLKW